MDDINDAQGEDHSTFNATTDDSDDDSSIPTDYSLSSLEGVSVVQDSNSSDGDPNSSTTASGTTKSGASYDQFSHLKRFSRQERRRIEGEILKGRKPGEPMTT